MDKKWDILSYLVMGFLFLLLVGRWPLLPNFIDIYYHIVTAQGFARAGGYVTHDFWSFAPAGRPHLYPPAFHLALAALLKTGLAPLAVARLADVVVFPLFLLVLFFFMRGTFNSRLAFFSVLVSASLYSFYLASSNFIPATLACSAGILSLWAQERDKRIAASLLLGICFYTHAQVPWFFLVAYLLYGMARRERLLRCVIIMAGGIAVALPELFYLYRMRAFYAPAARYENFTLEFNAYLVLAALGIRTLLREKKAYFLLGALMVAAIPFIASYPYRYLSGQGLVGLVLLSAAGVEQVYDAVKRAKVALLIFVLIFTFLSPAITLRQGQRAAFSWLNSTYVNLISWQGVKRPNDFSVSNSRYMRRVIDIIRDNSAEGDIICVNLPYAGTILSALGERADAQGMLAEVRPPGAVDPLSSAHLVVWFKEGSASGTQAMAQAVSRYSLEPIAETDIAFVFKNNATQAREQVRKADIPNGVLLAIAVCLALAIGWDLLAK